MSAPLFAWLVLTTSACATSSHRQTTVSQALQRTVVTEVDPKCVFCRASTSDRAAFDIVWEDDEFLAFRDRWPASVHHIQVIPKAHISSVKKLTRQDADMVRRMEKIGNDILDRLRVPQERRKMGFHIPPFNSIQHLHMHVQALPYTSWVRSLEYPVSRGFGPYDKGFGWFVEVGQMIRILEKGSTVRILPC